MRALFTLKRMSATAGIILPFLMIGGVFPARAANDEFDCIPVLLDVHGVHENEILDELKRFASGEVPNLNDPDQAALFEIYRYRYFGDPTTQLNPHTLSEIAAVMRKYPQLTKARFRSLMVGAAAPAKISEPLSKLILQVRNLALGQNGKIFKVNANAGFWNKVFEGLPLPTAEGSFFGKLASRISARMTNIAGERWKNYLPADLVATMEDEAVPGIEKGQKLFTLLSEIRAVAVETKGEAGLEVRNLTQVMADLSHSVPFLDRDLVGLLKSDDGYVVSDAFASLLARRDDFARTVGYADYPDLLRKLGIKQPSGLPLPNEKFMLQWNKLRTEGLAEWQLATDADRFTIRQLSPVESVYRSCIGGNECSSRTYGMKALDPNYHYFTMTDAGGHSSGHLTVVLGKGRNAAGEVNVAFIDKVQNVPPERIGVFLEGIRRSLENEGYLLASAKDLGDSSGLSNSPEVRTFFENYVRLEKGSPISGFKPNSHEFEFANKYSRADAGMDLYVVSPAENGRYTLRLADEEPFRPAAKVDLKKIAEEARAFRDGTERQQIIYVKTQAVLRPLGLADPDFAAHAERWLSDPARPYGVKKQILLASSPETMLELASKHLDPVDQGRFYTSVVSSPFYRDQIGVQRVYAFLNAHPEYLRQISSKSFSSFSVKRLLKLRLDEVLTATVESGAAKLDKIHPESGATLISQAAADGYTRGVLELAKSGADLNAVTADGRTPLMRSIVNRHVETSEAILDSGKALDLNKTDLKGKSAIAYAQKYRQLGVVKKLKRLGADIRAYDLYGNVTSTGLIDAVKDADHDVQKAILEGGATLEEINAVDKDGFSALMEAGRKCDAVAIELLLSHGATLSLLSRNQHNAAHFAHKRGCPPELIRRLTP